MRKILSLILLGSTVLGTSSWAEEFKATQDGYIQVNNHKIKLYTVDKHLFEKEGWEFNNTERQFKHKLTAEQAVQLDAYALKQNWYILVPKDWKIAHWSRGWGTGGIAATFEPKDKNGYITIYNTSGGSAMSAAAMYFPKIKQEAIENEFLSKKEAAKFPKLKLKQIDSGTVSYQGKRNESYFEGIAIYSNEITSYLIDVELSLPKTQKTLAKPILNWFILSRE